MNETELADAAAVLEDLNIKFRITQARKSGMTEVAVENLRQSLKDQSEVRTLEEAKR